jgi:hypothetical protein
MKKAGAIAGLMVLGVGTVIACGDDDPPPAPPADAGIDAEAEAPDACAGVITLTAVTPQFAWKDGRTPITITGTGFVATPKVSLVTGTTVTAIQHVAFVSGTSLTAVIPAGAAPSGTYDLRVANPNGCAATIAGGMKIVDQQPPTVLSVEPSAGTNQNDVPVTITGCSFDSNATVAAVSATGTVSAMPAPTSITAGPNDERCGGKPLFTMTAIIQTKTAGLVPGAYLVRVTNPTPGTFGEYASFVVSNPAGNPGNPEAVSTFVIGRRQLALVAGRIDDANRYLYAIGGENAAGDALDTIEVAQVDRFGQLGKWAVQRSKLPAALSGPTAVRWGKYIFVAGGTSAKNATGGNTPAGPALAKVYRATILSPTNAPVVKDPPTFVAGGKLAVGTWYYKVSAIIGGGDGGATSEESLASDEVVATLTDAGSVKLEWTAPAGPAPTGYKIYRSSAADGVSQSELLLDTVGAVTTYTDDGSKTPAADTPYLAAGATSSWVEVRSLGTARFNASAAALRAPNGNAFIYVTGGWGTAPLKSTEYARIGDDGALAAFTAGPDMQSARMRHGTQVLDRSTGPTDFGKDGGATATTSFLVSAGGRGTSAALESGVSVEYSAIGSDGTPGTWAYVPGFGARDALGFGIANGWFYAFVGASNNGNYVQTAESSQVSGITATTFALGSWNSTGSFLSNVPNGKRGRIGLTAESAYFYLAGGTTNDSDALADVFRVLH